MQVCVGPYTVTYTVFILYYFLEHSHYLARNICRKPGWKLFKWLLLHDLAKADAVEPAKVQACTGPPEVSTNQWPNICPC